MRGQGKQAAAARSRELGRQLRWARQEPQRLLLGDAAAERATVSPLPPRAGVKARRLSHAGPGPGHRRSHPGGWTAAAGARRGRARLQVPPRPEGGLHGWPCGVCTRGRADRGPGLPRLLGQPPGPLRCSSRPAWPRCQALPGTHTCHLLQARFATEGGALRGPRPDSATRAGTRAPHGRLSSEPDPGVSVHGQWDRGPGLARKSRTPCYAGTSQSGAQARASATGATPPARGPPRPPPTRPSSRHPEAHAGAGPVPPTSSR